MTSNQTQPNAPLVAPVFEDNPELVDKALKRVRDTFNTGKTKPYKYRVT